MDLRWEVPGEREVSSVATFIDSEGAKLHAGFGGTSHFSISKKEFIPDQPYLQLAQALREYIRQNLRIPFEGEYQGKVGDELCEKILLTEKQYGDRTGGRWHSIWYKMGGKTDMLEGWVNLIPDEHGLAVVKMGLAVVLKLSQDSTERRNKILETFDELRNALTRADPRRTSFRGHTEIRECTDTLYQVVVESIEDMIVLISRDKMTWRNCISKSKSKKTLPDTDAILQKVADHTKAFERAVGWARDQIIEETGNAAQYTAFRTTLSHMDVKATKKDTGLLVTGVQRYGAKLESVGDEVREVRIGVEQLTTEMKRKEQQSENHGTILNQILEAVETQKSIAVQEREKALEASSLDNRNLLFGFLLEYKRMSVRVENLEGQLQRTKNPMWGMKISPEKFCQILGEPKSSLDEPPDLESNLQHANKDLAWVLVQRGRFKANDQSQAQSLVRHSRFLEWMKARESDLILVDANISATGMEKISAVSLFSATFVTSLLEIQPEDVVTHFFCGLHLAPRDSWYGPNGLIRSLSMQLFIKLVELDILDLDFVNEREYFESLKEHDLSSLCETLASLISQFPPETTIFCIVDSLSCFDKDKTFEDLQVVITWLQNIVEDQSMAPTIKVLLMTPLHSSRRLKMLSAFRNDPSWHVSLSSLNLIPNAISNRSLETCLLQSTPSAPPI
ncbi:hypothetical protein HYFRA_00010358 [Hymenoscyphus fraxineus]|uniref:Uncharacterized protein n=1 Tax=Hymenoscyphus fraxineus TaxID=746836 RepID=A0A9N9PQ81_9HELO|nr:hypothetical protein HYFRA_00010358 [Hymenoscyphus fraxineus]